MTSPLRLIAAVALAGAALAPAAALAHDRDYAEERQQYVPYEQPGPAPVYRVDRDDDAWREGRERALVRRHGRRFWAHERFERAPSWHWNGWRWVWY